MFKLSKESKITFFCLLVIPLIWIAVNHYGWINGWKVKSVDLRLASNLPGARGEISHIMDSTEEVVVDGNKTIPKIPKVVYVNFDSATLGMEDVGERPWDRAFFRDMSMALLEKGNARVLAFDFAFTPKSVSKMVPKENSFRSDSAMGDLVLSYPNNVVLGNVYSMVSTPFVPDTIASSSLPRFDDGYSLESSITNEFYNYPESPTYPMQNFINKKYVGRAGSFSVPPYKAVDSVKRWVPIWFPAGGKAHAYNILGGKASNLPFEMPLQHKQKILVLERQLKDLESNESSLRKNYDKLSEELIISEAKRENAKTLCSNLSEGISELEGYEEAIKNFSSVLESNPNNTQLIANVKPLLDGKLKEMTVLVRRLSKLGDSSKGEEISYENLIKEIGSQRVKLSRLKKNLEDNPGIPVFQQQIDLTLKVISDLEMKLSGLTSEESKVMSIEEISIIFSQIREKLKSNISLLEKCTSEVELIENKRKSSKNSLDNILALMSGLLLSKDRFSGIAPTELVESNDTLRLVYAREGNDNGLGNLIDSLPNEVPLHRERDIYTLGVESLLAYYGLGGENVLISGDGSTFSIIDNTGKPLIEVPLEEKQWVEVNWFSKWSEHSVFRSLKVDAKRAYAEKDFELYRNLMPDFFVNLLSQIENITVPKNISDYPDFLLEMGIEEEEVEIVRKLLSSKTSDDNLPSFKDLSRVEDAISYYAIPHTLRAKYNPMCGMKDVIQYARFQDEVVAKISELENKTKILEGPKYLEKINAALIKEPGNKNYISQQKEILDVIRQNKEKLDLKLAEFEIIEEFFSYFKDAIIMIGPEEKTFNDLAPTPFDKAETPKVAVHGNLIKTISSGIYIKRLPDQIDHIVTLGLGLLMAFLSVYQGKGASWVKAGGVAFLLGYLFTAFVVFSNTHVVWPITAPACAGISTSFIGLAVMVVIEQKAKGRLKGMFGSYVSSELVDQMVESGKEPSLGGQETPITAFFSDVQAFSSFSELLSPTGLVDLMNEYLTAMTNILQEERGTLDKYIGDAIVAMYGAPIPMDDHAYQSVRTAILMQQEQIKLREKWSHEAEKWGSCHGLVTKMQTRIGCNTGTATVGNMGALDRFNYTMMGDMVNLAARCESGAKAYGAYIMITEETKIASEKTRDDIAFRYLDRIVVKGRKQPVAMYEPTGFMSELSQETQDCLDCFKQGIDKYLLQDWDGALGMFEKAKNLEPNKPGITPGVADNPSIILIDRCKVMKENPPGSDWDGVYVMTSK